jgi:hypothetical protein
MNGTRIATLLGFHLLGSNCHEIYKAHSDNFSYPKADNSFCAHSLLSVARHEGKTSGPAQADASAS